MSEKEVLEKKIRNGYRASIVYIILQLITVALLYKVIFTSGVVILSGVVCGLVIRLIAIYGVYKKSRVAITFLIFEFVFSNVNTFYLTNKLGGFPIISLICFIFFVDAMIATYKYHKLSKNYLVV